MAPVFPGAKVLCGYIDRDEIIVLEFQHGDDLTGAVAVVIIPGGREFHGDVITQEVNFPAGQQLDMEIAGHRLGLLGLMLHFHNLLPKSKVFCGQIGDGPDCNTTDDHRYDDSDDDKLGECGENLFHGDHSPFFYWLVYAAGAIVGFLAFIIHDNCAKCQNGLFTAIAIDWFYKVFCGYFKKCDAYDDSMVFGGTSLDFSLTYPKILLTEYL